MLSSDRHEQTLDVYLLPAVAWEQMLAIQQRLVYELSEQPRRRAALILGEHFPVITVGRQGSRRHILVDDDELRSRRIDVHWTNRGGGCWLQCPGQLAAYPILPLDPSRMGLEAYRNRLYQVLLDVLEEFRIPAVRDVEAGGVVATGREIASVGIAVKNWVAYHGCRLNVCVPLHAFECVQSNPSVDRPMTCMFRELRTPIQVQAVRESFLRCFVAAMGFRNYYLCRPPAMDGWLRRPANVATGHP